MPGTATLLLLSAGHRVLLVQGCQMHFNFGLSWGFMLSEKFPHRLSLGSLAGMPLHVQLT